MTEEEEEEQEEEDENKCIRPREQARGQKSVAPTIFLKSRFFLKSGFLKSRFHCTTYGDNKFNLTIIHYKFKIFTLPFLGPQWTKITRSKKYETAKRLA